MGYWALLMLGPQKLLKHSWHVVPSRLPGNNCYLRTVADSQSTPRPTNGTIIVEPNDTDDSSLHLITRVIAQSLTNAHPGEWYFQLLLDRHFIIIGGTFEYYTPFGRTPANMSNSKASHPVDIIHPNDAGAGMDTGVSMEATAASHQSGPIEPEARSPPVLAFAAPRAGVTSILSGSTRPTGTGTSTAMPAVAQTPTTGTSTGEAPNPLEAAPNTPATGSSRIISSHSPRVVCRGLLALNSNQKGIACPPPRYRYHPSPLSLSHPLVIVITPPRCRCRYRYHTPSLSLSHPLVTVITPPPYRYHTPSLSLSHPLVIRHR